MRVQCCARYSNAAALKEAARGQNLLVQAAAGKLLAEGASCPTYSIFHTPSKAFSCPFRFHADADVANLNTMRANASAGPQTPVICHESLTTPDPAVHCPIDHVLLSQCAAHAAVGHPASLLPAHQPLPMRSAWNVCTLLSAVQVSSFLIQASNTAVTLCHACQLAHRHDYVVAVNTTAIALLAVCHTTCCSHPPATFTFLHHHK